MEPVSFECWTCPAKGKQCRQQTFSTRNYKDCEAARKAVGNWIYSSRKDCNEACRSQILPVFKICWNCIGQGKIRQCYPMMVHQREKCKDSGYFDTKKDCQTKCFYQPINAPIEPVNPPLQPLTPPIQKVTKPRDKTLIYIIVAVVVLVLISVILILLYFLA